MTTTQFNLKLNKALHALQEHLETINHNYLLEGEENSEYDKYLGVRQGFKDFLLNTMAVSALLPGGMYLGDKIGSGLGYMADKATYAPRQIAHQAELVKDMFDNDLVQATNTDIIKHKYNMTRDEFDTWMSQNRPRVINIIKRKLQQGNTEQDIIYKILSDHLTKDPELTLRYK